MKELAIFLIIFIATNRAIAQPPAINIPNTSIIDTKTAQGKARDNIMFVNMTSNDFLAFDVYFFDEKQADWVIYGIAVTGHYFSCSKVQSPYEGFVGKLRYFAVASGDGEIYQYRIKKTHNDLYIYVYPLTDFSLTESEKEQSTIIDVSIIPGKFDGRIRFINKSSSKEASFWVYAFCDEEEQWARVGLVKFRRRQKKVFIQSPLGKKVADYTYFVFSARNGGNYDIDIQKKMGILLVTIIDK